MRPDWKAGFSALAAAALLVLAGTGSGVAGFFDYQKPQLPPSNDCAAVAAAVGPESTWHGEFSGRRYDSFSDRYFPFAARSCFASLSACREWQVQLSVYIEQGPITYTLCRRGG